MPLNCGKCKQSLRTAKTTNCYGGCGKVFCQKCTGLTDYEVNMIEMKKNVSYTCDECMDYKRVMEEKYECVLKEVMETKSKIAEQEKELREIANGFRRLNEREGKIMEKLKRGNNAGEETYAAKLKAAPPIIIQPKKKQEVKKTKEDLRDKVDPTNLKFTALKTNKNGAISIESENIDESKKIKSAIEEKLGKEYDVKAPELKKPKVRVHGMNTKWEEEEIVEKIKVQNDYLKEGFMKCLKIIEVKRANQVYYSAIIEMEHDMYEKVIGNGKVNIGWDRCLVYDGTTVKRCYKCLGFNHKSVECRNEEVCSKCLGKHDSRNCQKEQIEKCSNCVKANERLNLKLSVDHMTLSRECPVYLNKLKIEKKD